MTKVQVVQLDQVEGFQHGKDHYWYRPLLFGQNLFTYVAHVPPGGDMSADGHAEKEEFELGLFMLEGELEITCENEKLNIGAESAMLIPLGMSFGVKNHGAVTASFVLTFYPTPGIESLEWLRQRFAARGVALKSPDELKIMRAIGNQG